MAKSRETRYRELRVADNDKLVREMLLEKNKTKRLKVFDGDAHALLAYVYKDPQRDIVLRIDCAKAAIAYEKPKLQSVLKKDGTDADLSQTIKLEFIHPADAGRVVEGNGSSH